MTHPNFTIGQAIYWIARTTKSGEPKCRVPGHVIVTNRANIGILIRDTKGKGFIQYVSPKRLTPSNLKRLSAATLRHMMPHSQSDEIGPRSTPKISS